MKMLARLAAILSITLIIGCQHDSVSPPGTRLSSIVYHADGSDSVTYSTFKYDSSGRLFSLVDSESVFNQGEIRFFYGNDGKLNAAYEYYPRYDHYLTIQRDTFLYDNNGRIKEMGLKNDQGIIIYRRLLAHDNLGRLVADTARSEVSEFSYGVFVYSGAGDIESWMGYRIHDGIVDTSDIWRMTYTTIENPYKNMGVIFYLIGWDISVLSNHAIASFTPPPPGPRGDFGGPRTYTYELYPNGLVKSITCKENSNNPYVSHTDFYYE